MLTKKIDGNIKLNFTSIIGSILVFLIAIGLGYDYSIRNTGFQPSQPVAFSHRAHMEKYNIRCLYCHYSAERSSFSNIPTTHSCMVCHVALRNETALIKPLNESYDKKIPLKWNSVYRLPDYAHFDHRSHLRAMIDCSSCHGQVEKMDTVYQSKALTMKWCLDCHRDPVKFIVPARQLSGIFDYGLNYKDSNNLIIISKSRAVTSPAYGMYETGLNKQAVNGFPVSRLPGRGPETCSSCHY